MPDVVRRTFEAAKHPRGSAERARLNLKTVTSEYMPSYRYALVTSTSVGVFRTKAEAAAAKAAAAKARL